MVTNDGTIIQIKHDILCEVAKLVSPENLKQKKTSCPIA